MMNSHRPRELVSGNYYYYSPEYLRCDYTEKTDVWTCGVIMYLMLTGTPPFNGKSDEEIIQSILIGSYSLESSP